MESAFVDKVWNVVATVDANPAISHVELLFGTSDCPWNGKDSRSVTYYLTSIRPDLVLMSHRDCYAVCNSDFPDCFRIDEQRLCGRRFSKTPEGLSKAVRKAAQIHHKSIAREKSMWVVMVVYDKNGWWKRLETWEDINDIITANDTSNEKIDSFESFLESCHGLLIAVVSIIVIFLVLLLIHFVTKPSKNAKTFFSTKQKTK